MMNGLHLHSRLRSALSRSTCKHTPYHQHFLLKGCILGEVLRVREIDVQIGLRRRSSRELDKVKNVCFQETQYEWAAAVAEHKLKPLIIWWHCCDVKQETENWKSASLFSINSSLFLTRLHSFSLGLQLAGICLFTTAWRVSYLSVFLHQSIWKWNLFDKSKYLRAKQYSLVGGVVVCLYMRCFDEHQYPYCFPVGL